MINAIMIFYGFVFKRSSKTVIKISSVKSIEKSKRAYKKILEEGLKKFLDSIVFLKNWRIGTLPNI